MSTFAEIMEARVDHDGHGKQWQVGWLGANTGTLYPITTPQSEIRANEPGMYTPVYIDADE